LDNAVEQKSGIHDRTTCSCLRDFATPFYLKKSEKYTAVKSCAQEKGQTHDSCSLGQLIQYSHDSNRNTSQLHQQIQTYIDVQPPPPWKRLDAVDEFGDKYIWEFTQEYCEHVPTCPAEFLIGSTPLPTILRKMQEMVPQMQSYNKLSVPKFDFDIAGLNGKQQIYDEEAYREKYAVAFRTCLAVGVPHMTNNIVAVTNQVYWIVIGESILVFASAVSYAYSIALTLKEGETPTTQYQVAVVIVILFACVQFVVSCVLLFANQTVPIYKYLETLTWTGNTEAVLQPQNLNIFFGLFIFLWCFLALVSMISLGMSMFMKYKESAMSVARLLKKSVCCGEASTQATHYEALTKTDGQQIIKELFSAQIAIDLPIIIGLAITAVGIILQSGAAEYCVIITVLILFTSTGIVTHITNVMRMLHLAAQMVAQNQQEFFNEQGRYLLKGADQDQKHQKHMRNLVYNRVLIAVVIGGLIFVCLNLAGLDPAQAHDLVRLASQQQIILGVITFLVLVAADLSLEVTGLLYYVETPHQYVVDSVQSKCKHTAWFIVLGLLVLNFHARIFLCEREGKQLKDFTLTKSGRCENYGLGAW
jgi:hypothetical protein